MAKRLLSAKGATFTELNVDTTPGLREKMVKKTNRRTMSEPASLHNSDIFIVTFWEKTTVYRCTDRCTI
jgi:hypothetical protein